MIDHYIIEDGQCKFDYYGTVLYGIREEDRDAITSLIIPDTVEVIEEGAFSFCSRITELEIPASVSTIGKSAFYGCTGLTSIKVSPDNKYYDSREDCNAIIDTIDNMLLIGCKNTKIPDSVTEIGDSAFMHCSGLTELVIPDSVRKIHKGDFEGPLCGCTGLTSIKVSPNNKCFDSREDCNAIIDTQNNVLLFGCKNTKIPSSVTSIGPYAFFGCELTSIDIPDSVTEIGDSAFEDCHKLTKVKIPDSVEEIGDLAFNDCNELTELVIPGSVRTTGENSYAFHGCTGLTSIKVSPNNKYYDSREDCNAIIDTQDNMLLIGCKNTKIPSSVTSIGPFAFYGCELTSIDIPDSVTEIGDSAFVFCSGLTELVIPDSVRTIGEYAFHVCTGLTSIKVSPNNEYFDSREDCNAIIDTKNNMLLIGCKNTKIPSSVTRIGPYAFRGCELTSIDIPDSVTEIGEYAFEGCSELKEVKILSSVIAIKDSAFNGCTGLTELVIPASLREIGNAIFKRWSNYAVFEGGGNLKITRILQ